MEQSPEIEEKCYNSGSGIQRGRNEVCSSSEGLHSVSPDPEISLQQSPDDNSGSSEKEQSPEIEEKCYNSGSSGSGIQRVCSSSEELHSVSPDPEISLQQSSDYNSGSSEKSQSSGSASVPNASPALSQSPPSASPGPHVVEISPELRMTGIEISIPRKNDNFKDVNVHGSTHSLLIKGSSSHRGKFDPHTRARVAIETQQRIPNDYYDDGEVNTVSSCSSASSSGAEDDISGPRHLVSSKLLVGLHCPLTTWTKPNDYNNYVNERPREDKLAASYTTPDAN